MLYGEAPGPGWLQKPSGEACGYGRLGHIRGLSECIYVVQIIPLQPEVPIAPRLAKDLVFCL